MPEIRYEGRVGKPGGRIVLIDGDSSKIESAVDESKKRADTSRNRRKLHLQKGDAEGSIPTVDEATTDRFDRKEGLAPQRDGDECDADIFEREAYRDYLRSRVP